MTEQASGLTFGSLFAGIGGFDLGLERAGMVCKWHSEIDANCQELLASKWPSVKQIGDVRDVRRATAEPVDLICGGFPCQDVSVAGRRAGLAGERSGLWFEFHRVLGELEPRWVVIENVPGLLSSNGGRDFAAILSGLVELGYGVCWRVLDAQYFGVAQRRRRVFIVGHLGDGRAAQVLFERESGALDSAPSREKGQNIAGTLAADAHASGFNGQDAGRGNLIAHTLRGRGFDASEDETGRGTPLVAIPDPAYALGTNCFNGYTGGADDNDAQGGHLVFDTTQITSPGNHSNPKPGAPCHPLAAGAHAPAVIGIDWQQSGDTIIDGCACLSTTRVQAPLEPAGVRRLTPRECERLQGFPDDWTIGFSDSTRYRMLGNAVAVPCAEWIGRRIVAAAMEGATP